jgi:heme A synthase
MDKNFSKLCTPAKIYFGIAVIATIIALFNGVGIMASATQMIFAFIWTFVLGWLCDKGYSAISWFLVLLPYVVILLAMFGIAKITQHKEIMRAVKLQGAYGQEPMMTRENTQTYSPPPPPPDPRRRN